MENKDPSGAVKSLMARIDSQIETSPQSSAEYVIACLAKEAVILRQIEDIKMQHQIHTDQAIMGLSNISSIVMPDKKIII